MDLTDDSSVFLPAAPGIYAVYDKAGDLQYVGLSRRVSASLQSHLRDVPELCGSAKVSKFTVWLVPVVCELDFGLRIFSEAHVSYLLNDEAY